MADQTPKPANIPEPATEKRSLKKPRPDPGDGYQDLEDEPGYLDLEFQDTFGDPNVMSTSMRVVFTLLLIAVAAMVTYLVLLILYPDQFSTKQWIGGGSGGEQIYSEALPQGFELGGIRLGQSPSEVKRLYPSLRLEPAPAGEQKGYFLHHEGQYQVHFKAPDQGERAYRIQARHIFPKVSYLELLSELSGRYGQPAGSGCGASDQAAAIQCNLYWKFPGVSLTAEIKTSATGDGNSANTQLTVVADDLRPGSLFKKQKGLS